MIHLHFDFFSEKQLTQLVNFIVYDTPDKNREALVDIFDHLVLNNKYHGIITHIIKYGKINLDMSRNYNIIVDSVRYNKLEIVKILLDDKRIDPSIKNNKAILVAVENDNFPMIMLLLTDTRVDPSDQNDKSLVLACTNGNYDIVKILLEDTRVNPANCNNYAIKIASENGNIDIVKLLLLDKRVDVSNNNYYAVLIAYSNNYIEIVKLLLQKINMNNITNRQIIKIAIEVGIEVGTDVGTDTVTDIDTDTDTISPKIDNNYCTHISEITKIMEIMTQNDISNINIDTKIMTVTYDQKKLIKKILL